VWEGSGCLVVGKKRREEEEGWWLGHKSWGCLVVVVKERRGRSGHGSRDDGLWMDWRWMDDGYGVMWILT